MSYIVRTRYGAFCSVCQSQLGMEEDDWDECDACGGEGIDGRDESEDEFYEFDDDEETHMKSNNVPPDLQAVLGEALAKAKQK